MTLVSKAGSRLTSVLRSVLLALYRPYLLDSRAQHPDDAHDRWRSSVRRKAQAAAAVTNTVLMNLITADMIDVCQGIV